MAVSLATRWRELVAVLALLVGVLVVGPSPAFADSFNVNSTGDGGDANAGNGVCETGPGNGVCTLRAAVEEANSLGGVDTISVPAGTYVLGASLTVSSSMTISGAGAGTTTLDGDGSVKVFIVSGGSSTISDVTITGGHGDGGGAAFVTGGTITIEDAILEDNFGFTGGGAIYAQAGSTVNIHRTTMRDNMAIGAFGGALWNQGSMFVFDSLITDNESNRAGGLRNSGVMNLRNTTVSGNHANSPDAGTGGISQNGFLFMNNVTVTDNTGVGNNVGSFRGGGIQTSSGETTVMKNSIVAGNHGGTGPDDCVGELTSDSRYNLIGDSTGCVFLGLTTTYLLDVDPELGTLTNNGGPTLTHLPFSTSPVINAGAPVDPGGPAADACEGFDQRGILRLICDMGAVEREVSVPNTLIVNSTADVPDALPGDGTCETAAGNGICTLRAAVQESNHLPSTQTIEVPIGTYSMSIAPAGEAGLNPAAAGDLDFTDDANLVGASRESVVVDANSLSRVFDVHPGVAASLSQLTMREGNDSGGGGIRSTSSSLTLDSVIIEDNSSSFDGGGVLSGLGLGEELTITDSIIRNNDALSFGADGGGIAAADDVVITDTEVYGNDSEGSGGGIDLTSGTLTRVSVYDNETNSSTFGNGGGISAGSVQLIQSTVSDNSAAAHGGGVFSATGSLTNSTISGNTSGTSGGGVSTNNDLLIESTTVADNTATDGANGLFIFGALAEATLHSSILYNPGALTECAGITTPGSLGGNVLGDASCALAGPGDQSNTDPQLGPLGSNGGPTATHLPGAGSPVIDNGADTGVGVDQRGVARPQNGGFDAGSVEVESTGPPACTITGTNGDDILVGTADPDVICGRGGNDIIYGQGGDDILRGGGGNDEIFGGLGDDEIKGNAGNDRLLGGLGEDSILGGPGADVLRGKGNDDSLEGNKGNDRLFGGKGDDILNGGLGSDTCNGGLGSNTLISC